MDVPLAFEGWRAVTGFGESVIEQAALEWLGAIGWQLLTAPDIAPGAAGAERMDYREAILEGPASQRSARLNPDLPSAALEDAFRKLTRPKRARA
ncbi:MAG: hypothetical protein U5R14_08465 [Gemmatimonadota bacterium]|nr:hypothetical protein [Gemmatimonadota bacterium]